MDPRNRRRNLRDLQFEQKFAQHFSSLSRCCGQISGRCSDHPETDGSWVLEMDVASIPLLDTKAHNKLQVFKCQAASHQQPLVFGIEMLRWIAGTEEPAEELVIGHCQDLDLSTLTCSQAHCSTWLWFNLGDICGELAKGNMKRSVVLSDTCLCSCSIEITAAIQIPIWAIQYTSRTRIGKVFSPMVC